MPSCLNGPAIRALAPQPFEWPLDCRYDPAQRVRLVLRSGDAQRALAQLVCVVTANAAANPSKRSILGMYRRLKPNGAA